MEFAGVVDGKTRVQIVEPTKPELISVSSGSGGIGMRWPGIAGRYGLSVRADLRSRAGRDHARGRARPDRQDMGGQVHAMARAARRDRNSRRVSRVLISAGLGLPISQSLAKLHGGGLVDNAAAGARKPDLGAYRAW
jgi:hypothetical protein